MSFDITLQVLLDSALKAAVLLVCAILASLFLRRSSAARRHLLWSATLCATILIPALSVLLPQWQVLPGWFAIASPARPSSLPQYGLDEAQTAKLLPAAIEWLSGNSPRTIDPPRSKAVVAVPVPARIQTVTVGSLKWRLMTWTWRDWICLTWAAGAIACLMPLLIGTLAIWRIRTRAQSQIANLKSRIEFPILLSSHCHMPMACGILRPVIILPADADAWPAQRLHAVLAHEQAHLRRRDCLWQMLGQLARALYWFNPLAWIAYHRLLAESERACDDTVLDRGSRPSDYAEHLLSIATSGQSDAFLAAAAIAMAGPNRLEGRLLSVLDATRSRKGVTFVVGAALLLVLGGLVVPLAMLRAGRPAASLPATQPIAGESAGVLFDRTLEEAQNCLFVPRDGKQAESAMAAPGPVLGKAFLELATGRVMQVPADVTDQEQARKWVLEQWADLACVDGRLVSLEDRVQFVGCDGAFREVQLEGFTRIWMSVTSMPGVSISREVDLRNRDTGDVLFRTRDGGMGVLQVVSAPDRSKGVTLHYRLLQAGVMRGPFFVGIDPEASADARNLLQQRYPEINWDNTPLIDAVQSLRVGWVNIFVQWKKMEEANIPRDTPISAHLENATLETVFATMAQQILESRSVMLGCTCNEGVFTLYPTQHNVADASDFVTRVYDVADLAEHGLAGLPQEQAKLHAYQRLKALEIDIRGMVDPASWSTKANRASIQPSPLASHLIVTTRAEAHAEIARLLNAIREKLGLRTAQAAPGPLRPEIRAPAPQSQPSATALRTAATEAATSAALPNGVTVELLGICEHPSKGKQWWRPDGSTVDAPYDDRDRMLITDANVTYREFAVRIVNPHKETWTWDSSPSAAMASTNSTSPAPTKSGKRVEHVYRLAAAFPIATKVATLRLGIGSGDWDTVQTSTGIGHGTGTAIKDGSKRPEGTLAVFSEAIEADQKTTIVVAHNIKGQDCRVVAVDREGKEHSATDLKAASVGGAMGDLVQILAPFNMPLTRIADFRLQIRPYQWVEFKDVPLSPKQTHRP